MFRDNHRFEWKVSVWSALLAAIILVSTAGADEIELDNGRVFKGKVLSQTSKLVVFQREGDKGTIRVLNNRIVRMDIDGGKSPKAGSPGAPGQASVGKKPFDATNKSRASINAIINETGPTKPDWWDSVEMNYPKTLDLSGKIKVKGWKPQRNLGAYLFSVVNPNQSRWKPAIKLLHHVINVRKGDKPRQAAAMQTLGTQYLQLLGDYPRAAYWVRRARAAKRRLYIGDVMTIAECYWKLGNTQMAISELRKYGLDRKPHGAAIKFYTDIGMPAKALSLAKALAKGRPGEGNLLAGNIECKRGNYDAAIASYQRVLNTEKGSRYLRRYKSRAKRNTQIARICKTLDISKLTDGTYRGTAKGYEGPIDVEVTVQAGRIEAIKITKERESLPSRSLKDMPTRIIEAQSLRIDSVTKATITSDAIIAATANALAVAPTLSKSE